MFLFHTAEHYDFVVLISTEDDPHTVNYVVFFVFPFPVHETGSVEWDEFFCVKLLRWIKKILKIFLKGKSKISYLDWVEAKEATVCYNNCIIIKFGGYNAVSEDFQKSRFFTHHEHVLELRLEHFLNSDTQDTLFVVSIQECESISFVNFQVMSIFPAYTFQKQDQSVSSERLNQLISPKKNSKKFLKKIYIFFTEILIKVLFFLQIVTLVIKLKGVKYLSLKAPDLFLGYRIKKVLEEITQTLSFLSQFELILVTVSLYNFGSFFSPWALINFITDLFLWRLIKSYKSYPLSF